MQKDFHYYCIVVLGKVAGFNKGDALTIASASQYANGSTESEPIRFGALMFDPVRTAYIGLKAFDWPIQSGCISRSTSFHPIQFPQKRRFRLCHNSIFWDSFKKILHFGSKTEDK